MGLGPRHGVGHGRQTPVRAPRRLRAARGQGARPLGDGPGHRRHKGRRRPEELHAFSSLTQRQAVVLLEAIPTDTLQGIRDLAMMSVFFLTGCRVSAVVAACVGHLETDGVEHYLNVTRS